MSNATSAFWRVSPRGSNLRPFDSKAAYQAGQIRAGLERKGTPIGAYNLMIAGQARAEGLILVTSNTREFKRVPGLRIENWA